MYEKYGNTGGLAPKCLFIVLFMYGAYALSGGLALINTQCHSATYCRSHNLRLHAVPQPSIQSQLRSVDRLRNMKQWNIKYIANKAKICITVEST